MTEGYSDMFKSTLSPCYENTQKKGWHGGKSKKKTTKKTKKTQPKKSSKSKTIKKTKTIRKKTTKKTTTKKTKKGGSKTPTCQSTVPTWHNRGEPWGRAADISYGTNIYQFTRTLPNGKLYTAFNYGKSEMCGSKFPEIMPKVGGGKVKMTIGKDGRKYFFKNGKRVKNM